MTKKMIKVGIIGATGYTGEELIRILLRHSGVRISSLTAKIEQPARISEIFPQFEGLLDLECQLPDTGKVVDSSSFVFLALPHRISMEVAPRLLEAGKKVVDLSADYRLRDAAVYEKWYGVKHGDPEGLSESVYGLPELNRDAIRKARLIANPGCYPTGVILALAPVLRQEMIEPDEIICDSYSGATGAGRHANLSLIFPEIDENLKAYKINRHQHQPEIEQELTELAKTKVKIVFVPHLAPVDRGILTTIYLKLKRKASAGDICRLYDRFYAKEPFVRVLTEGKTPGIKDVRRSNFCNLGITVEENEGRLIIVSAIDNLTKGAAGQAVQSMNIMEGFSETEGLL